MASSSRSIYSIARLYSPLHESTQVVSSTTRTLQHQTLMAPQGLEYRYLVSNFPIPMQNKNIQTRNLSIFNGVQPAPLPNPQPPVSPLKWFFGIMATVVIPFAANTSGTLVKYKVEVDTVVTTIEDIVDMVEKVADVVDKVAEGISDELPEDGRLKRLLDKVENAAEVAANDARTLGDAIDKFQEVEAKVGSLIGSHVKVQDNNQVVKDI